MTRPESLASVRRIPECDRARCEMCNGYVYWGEGAPWGPQYVDLSTLTPGAQHWHQECGERWSKIRDEQMARADECRRKRKAEHAEA